MTGDRYAVTIQLAMPPPIEGCAVLIIDDGGTSEIVADGLGIVTAVRVAAGVRASLDKGHGVAAVRLALENGEIPA